MNKILLPLLLMFLLFPFNIYCADEKDQEPSYWEQIKKKFEEATSDDREMSREAKEWIEEDIKKIGDWEYKVFHLKLEDIDQLENKLNVAGDERWECFWMEMQEKEFLLIFKRPKISYLQKIPKGELFRMLNSSDGG